jgi:meso-butanediol dehydrogenase / (S,S)-butanediol dehydrogenase / diacetyl reductase
VRLEGMRAIVTGGASGIGRAMARRFAVEGAAVAVADLDEDRAQRVVAEIVRDGGRGLAVPVDVTDEDRVGAMVEEIRGAFGGIDVLVNNANRMPADNLLTMTAEQWDADVRMTLRSPFLCTRAVLGGMISQGSGTILNIASVNGLGFYGNEGYSAAKAGMINLTRSVAVRFANKGIRANAIAPGTVRTPGWDERLAIDPDTFEKVASWYPTQRIGEPEDIANAALFLVSDEASWITGAVLPVDGGLTAGNYRMTVDLLPGSDL